MSLLSTAIEQGLTPDVIDETNPNDIYLGYFKYNSKTDPAHCLIKRVTKVDGITKIRYPYGQFSFSFVWDQRAEYTDWRYRDFKIERNIIPLGYHYNLFTLLDPRGIAPEGFHLPTFEEMTLWGNSGNNPGENYKLITDLNDINSWYREYEAESNNITGFSAVPAGYYFGPDDVLTITKLAAFWCAYTDGTYGRYGVISYNNYMNISPTSIPKQKGLSVRFIKDNNIFDPDEIVYDIDGNEYGTCRANDNQVWTNKNYFCSRFNDGSLIPTITDEAEWMGMQSAGKRAPLNNESYV